VLRVTADTSVFISALVFPGGKPFQLLQLARSGKINLTVSEAILDEIGGVLARKFNWPPEDIAQARKWITGLHGRPCQRSRPRLMGFFRCG